MAKLDREKGGREVALVYLQEREGEGDWWLSKEDGWLSW